MKRYALVIGISQYDKLPSLRTPTGNAEAVATLLEASGCFDEVRRFPQKWTHDRCEVSRAKFTREELSDELKRFLEDQASQRNALIYFSGHGLTVADSLGERDGFIAPSDCHITWSNGVVTNQNNGIAFRSLNTLIKKSNLSSLVMLLDCCHSGDFVSQEIEHTFTEFGNRKDYYLIAACQNFEKAYEGEGEYSIFTTALLEGLSVRNADANGKVTADRLFDYIANQLKGSGQEPVRKTVGGSISVIEYDQTQILAIETLQEDSLSTALRLLEGDFELLDEPFFNKIRRSLSRSHILKLPTATWAMILQGNYIERDQQGDALQIAVELAKHKGISLLLIRGEPGAGKTALMRWLVYELVCQGKWVLQKKLQGDLGWIEQLQEFSTQVEGQHFYVIADDLFRDESLLDELQQNEFLPNLTLLGTTRFNESQHESLEGLEYEVQCLDLARPSHAEKERILAKVCQDDIVQTKVQSMNAQQRQQLMNSPVMLVLMLQLSEGKPFDQILIGIIQNLSNSLQRPTYQVFGLLCSFFQYGVVVPSEIIELCIPSFKDSQSLVLDDLEGLIDTVATAVYEGLTTIHELIAQTAIQTPYKLRTDSGNPSYVSVQKPPLLERYLRTVLQQVDYSKEIQKQWVYRSLNAIARLGEPELVRSVLNEYAEKIQAMQQGSSGTAWAYWANTYRLLGMRDEQSRCIAEILSTQPKVASEWTYWLALTEKLGTKQQRREAIEQAQIWLLDHPEDVNVRVKYLSSIESSGRFEQKRAAIEQTQTWLLHRPEDTNVRKQYLVLIEKFGTVTQKRGAIEQTQTWLLEYSEDTNVRVKYLSLIEKFGTVAQKQEAIEQTQTWLLHRPENTNVRQKYLAIIATFGTAAQKQEAIEQTQTWLLHRPEDINVREKYLALIKDSGTVAQKQEAIEQTQTWLLDHPEDTNVRQNYLALIESSGTVEQQREAIEQTQTWLLNHPEDSNVRRKYLALVPVFQEDAEFIQNVINQQWQWINQQQITEQSLWEAFLPILYHHTHFDLAQKAIELVLQQYSDSVSIATVVFGYFRNYLNYDTCYKLADIINQKQLPIQKWRHLVDAANFFRDYGQLKKAENIYRNIINSLRIRAKNGMDIQKTLDYTAISYARLHLMKDPPDTNSAQNLIDRILKKNSKHAVGHWLMARCYQAKGSRFHEKAVESFQKAIQLDRNKEGFFWYELGCFYRDVVQDVPKTRSCFEKSLLQKITLSACIDLAELECEVGNLSRAKYFLQQGLDWTAVTRPEKEQREKLDDRIQALRDQLGL